MHELFILIIECARQLFPYAMLCLLYVENLILLLLLFQCGRSMNPNFIFSWPQARVGVASQAHITQASSEVSCDTVHVRGSILYKQL